MARPMLFATCLTLVLCNGIRAAAQQTKIPNVIRVQSNLVVAKVLVASQKHWGRVARASRGEARCGCRTLRG
jgi:hypothetical protein